MTWSYFYNFPNSLILFDVKQNEMFPFSKAVAHMVHY